MLVVGVGVSVGVGVGVDGDRGYVEYLENDGKNGKSIGGAVG